MTDPRLHFHQPLSVTPFHPRTAAANRLNQWAAWAGYTSALVYDDETMEYAAIRNSASVYDLCPMVKYRIEGPGAAACLDRLTLRAVSSLPVGAVQYTAWCDDAGKVLDDGTLFRLAPERFLLCCQERHLPWLLDGAIGYEVEIAEITSELAALALQGPCAFAVLRSAGFGTVAGLRPFRHVSLPFRGSTLTISRTGFTADLGYEIFIEPGLALPLWDLLFSAGAPWHIRPVGSRALDIARIEAGFIVANTDFVPAEQALREDRARSPFELGLDWMIDWNKGPFNGRRALAAERDSDSSRWALVALDIEGNVSAAGALVYLGGKTEVGTVTSACWSPATKRNIALAQIRRPHRTSTDLRVEIYALRELQYHRLMLRARPTARPFFSPPRRRATPPGDS